jgi:outer membrane protein assembly factor BamB
MFGSAVIAALDFDGHIAWRKDIIPYSFDVTVGSSPVVFGETVILLSAMAKSEDSRVTAMALASGEPRWETKLKGTGFGHSTPLIIDVKGEPQMVIVASGMSTTPEAVQSLDPRTGRRIWWCQGAGDAASPAYGSGLLYIDSGRGSPGWAIDPTGTGEVTGTGIRWKVPQVPEGISSPLILGGRVYRLHQPGVLKCWSAADGAAVFSARLEGISSTWASPIADPAGRIFFATAGKSVVIQAGPELKVLGTNDLGDPNHASPAVAAGRMFLLGTKRLFAIGKK